MHNDEYTQGVGLEMDSRRTIYMTSGTALSGRIVGHVTVSRGDAFEMQTVSLMLDGGDTVSIPWHSVAVIAARPIGEWA